MPVARIDAVKSLYKDVLGPELAMDHARNLTFAAVGGNGADRRGRGRQIGQAGP